MRLSASDVQHFYVLSNTLKEASNAYKRRTLSDDRCNTLARYAWTHFHAPVRALGLPPGAVRNIIDDFVFKQGCFTGYGGNCYNIIRYDGFTVLATKFIVDRNVLIPRVAPNAASVNTLLEALEKRQQQFFVSLPTFSYRIRSGPDRSMHTMQTEGIVLTERSKRYQARRARMLLTEDETRDLSGQAPILSGWVIRLRALLDSVVSFPVGGWPWMPGATGERGEYERYDTAVTDYFVDGDRRSS